MYLHWFRIDIMQHFLIYFSLIYYFCDISVNKNYYKKGETLELNFSNSINI